MKDKDSIVSFRDEIAIAISKINSELQKD
jgi:hypothetical protein